MFRKSIAERRRTNALDRREVKTEDIGNFDMDFSCRRYQDFYLLEQKLTEFHGVFSDARLPLRRSAAIARSLEFLESVKKDFEHFLRVRASPSASLEILSSFSSIYYPNPHYATVNCSTTFSSNRMTSLCPTARLS